MGDPVTTAFVPTGRRWSYQDTIRTGVGAVTLVAGGLVAARGVPHWEASIFEAVNGLPDVLYPAVWRTRRLSVGVCTAGAVGATWLAAKYVKGLVGRGRPFGVGLEVHLRDHAASGLGYVSGHSALAAALYVMVVPHLRPRFRPVAAVLALTVGVARIYSGAHLPLDVVGGASLGMIVGEAFRVIEVRWRSGRLPAAEDLTAPDPVTSQPR